MRWMFVASTGLWTPERLSDLRCWLDASDSATITESGGSISLWEDKAGSNDASDAVDAANATITTARPTLVSADQNGLDAIGFNGSQWFDHNSAKGMLKNRSCAMLAVAMKYATLTTTRYAWINRHSSGTPYRFQLLSPSSSMQINTQRLDGDTANTVINVSADPPANTNWHIHVAVLDWTNGGAEYFIDGTSGGTDSYASSGNTSDTDLDSLYNTRTAIGAIARNGGSELPSGSRIGEMVCGAKASGSYGTADRQRLEGYLAHKWGLEASLPGDHPYASAPPTV